MRQQDRITLYGMDCRDAMGLFMAENSVDSVITDPPYGLSDHKPGEVQACLRAWLNGEQYAPKGKGFMGKGWDAWVPGPEVWKEAFTVLKPGGHMLVFAGTRSMDLMSMAIRLAGFELRDAIGYAHDGGGAPLAAWCYGSGFPKSLDVSKAIDKAAGAERVKLLVPSKPGNSVRRGDGEQGVAFGDSHGGFTDASLPVTAAAAAWQGWGTALKPAWEPVIIARKPLGSLPINIKEIVEQGLRQRGVEGEIQWNFAVASAANKKSSRTISSSIEARQVAETSAGSAVASGMLSDAKQTESSSALTMPLGGQGSGSTSRPTPSANVSNCGMTSCAHTESNALAAESASAPSSLSTTSTVEAPVTVEKFTGRSSSNFDDLASRLDTEPFAGIATGLTGSMAHVLINLDSQGCFVWPKGLPQRVEGVSLTVAANVLHWGTGALNIDACRVATDENLNGGAYSGGNKDAADATSYATGVDAGVFVQPDGRWPANLIHDGSDEVLAAFPQAPGQLAPESFTAPSSKTRNTYGERGRRAGGFGDVGADRGSPVPNGPMYSDKGSAARFFYCAKASKKDRNEGLTGMPELQYSHDGRETPIDNAYQRNASANHHPTVKPTDLMAYLCRLVTPPGGVVLDPFMGSGSTGKAALREGFRFIGCELDDGYMAIAAARLAAEVAA